MSGSIEQGTSQTQGNTHILHFLARIPRRVEEVWAAVAISRGGFNAADVLKSRLGGTQ